VTRVAIQQNEFRLLCPYKIWQNYKFLTQDEV
jgi:hypothetical protein